MKIDDNLTASTYLRPNQTEAVRNEPAPPGGGRTSPEGEKDSVALSSLGSEIARVLSQDSPEEITKVSAAREAVESGSILSDASELADSLIDAALTETSFQTALSSAPSQ